jgi:hypothetical protein
MPRRPKNPAGEAQPIATEEINEDLPTEPATEEIQPEIPEEVQETEPTEEEIQPEIPETPEQEEEPEQEEPEPIEDNIVFINGRKYIKTVDESGTTFVDPA